MKDRFRLLVRDCLYLLRLWLLPHRGGIILAYHAIGETQVFFSVRTEEFEWQMHYLHTRGYTVVSLDELMTRMQEGKSLKKLVAITFDDGYEDFRINAHPILKRYSFPATVFLITGALGTERQVRGELLPLLKEIEVQAISQESLISFGAHTVTHPRLPSLDTSEAEREIHDSRATVERLTGAPALHFAYPYGRNSLELQAVAQRAGIRYAYTTEPGVLLQKSEQYALPRNGVDARTTRTAFRGTVHRGRLQA